MKTLLFAAFVAAPLAAQQVDVVAIGATKIGAAATTVGRSKSIRNALTVTPRSKLVVHWWEPVDLATLVHKTPICGSHADPEIEPPPARPFRADLLQCPDQKPGLGINTVNPNQCTVVVKKELPLDVRRGTIEWNGVAAGLYFLRFAYPGLPDFHQAIEVTSDRATTIDTSLRYYSFFGRVTEGAAPVHARVFGTVSDPETGRYVAVLTRMPHEEQPYRVLPCDGSEAYTFVPDEPPKEKAAFDIDIPSNEITVDVTDDASGAPVSEASVMFAAIKDGEKDSAYFSGDHGQTDSEGHYVIKHVLRNKELQLCALRKDYQSRCENFRMEAIDSKEIALKLTRADVHQGRVIASAPLGYAMVMFNAAGGRQLEWVRVDADGSFTYKQKHVAGEIICVASTDGPFYATHMPPLEEGATLELTLPHVRSRTFRVTMSGTGPDDAFPAIALGDFIVPMEPLNQQVMWHGFQSALIKGWTITIPDILETAPIRVAAVPDTLLVRRDTTGIDSALLPEARGLVWKPLGESDILDFP